MRIRATVLVVIAALLIGPAPAAAAPEDDGAACAVPALPDPNALPTNARLPDPFRRIDGSRITTKADWICRRAEIREMAERYVYGEKPGRPQTVTGTVSSTGITVNVTHQGRTASFTAGVQLPAGTGPFPAVAVYGGFGADTAGIRAAGAAVISFDPYVVGREGTPRNNKQGAFYTLYDWTTPNLGDGPPTTPPPTTPPPTTPPPASGCSAAVSLNSWTGGFVATVRVTAGSAPVNGWAVGVTLPSGASITNSWNAERSGTSGAVRFSNVAWNGAIPAGGAVEFGFQGTGSGAGLTPTCTT